MFELLYQAIDILIGVYCSFIIHNTYILIVIVIVLIKFHKNLSESVLLLVKACRDKCLGLRIE